MAKHVLIVGAGFTGATVARQLAEAGHRATVIDERSHIAGNCHTARDAQTGVMVHEYGPHIFHTGNRAVWDFINQHCTMMPYRHQVKARVGDQVYALPINLHTINQFFDRAMTPRQAQDFVAAQSEASDTPPQSFEDQALQFVGRAMYDAFFKGYTLKQWGQDPRDLPASILQRLPLRFTYDDNYFAHPFQGIPFEGYTHAVASILDHPAIAVRLNTRAEDMAGGSDHTLYTGPLDRFFGHNLGRLRYRSLRFDRAVVPAPYQGTAVMNYCDENTPYTRITEHCYFAPWDDLPAQSVIFTEYSFEAGPDDIPYYPVRLTHDKTLLAQYVNLAQSTPNVTFAGRLGTYAYIDMDVAIARAFDVADHLIAAFDQGNAPQAFVHPM